MDIMRKYNQLILSCTQAKKENRHIPQYKLDLLRELKNKMEIGNSEYLESDINYKRLKYLFDEQ